MFLRIFIIIICTLISFYSSYSQKEYFPVENDFKLSFGFRQSHVFFNNSSQLNISLEYFVNDNLSLEYSIASNFSSDNTFIHAPLGLVAGLSLLGDSWESDYSSYDYLILLLALIPEGINFYIPMNEKMNIIPFIHPFGYDYVINDYSVTSSVGMKLEINLNKKISLNPFSGIKLFYKLDSATFGFDIGILLGIKF